MDNNYKKTNIPLGLNIEDFMPKNNIPIQQSLNYMEPESEKREIIPFDEDRNIIDGLFENASNYKQLITKRIKNLYNIEQIWNDGKNKKETFEFLLQQEDQDVINDVINFCFIKTELKYMDVRSKEIVLIFPILIKMISSKYNIYFKNGILAAWKILKYLSRVIIESKKSQYMNPRNIDLEKEAKLKIYNQIINYYKQIKNLDNIGIYLNKDSREVGFNLADFILELNEFLREIEF
jgi:hypothetical protein